MVLYFIIEVDKLEYLRTKINEMLRKLFGAIGQYVS